MNLKEMEKLAMAAGTRTVLDNLARVAGYRWHVEAGKGAAFPMSTHAAEYEAACCQRGVITSVQGFVEFMRGWDDYKG